MLAENEHRWESLSEADRERVEALARAIASRMLHEPTLRLKRASGDEDSYLYVSALRELFGLDVGTEPLAAGRRRGDRARLATQAPRPLRLGTRGSALALAQAEAISGALGGLEIVAIETSGDRGEGGDKARFVKEIEEALLDEEIDLAVHSAKDLPADIPDGLALVGVSEREDPADAYCGAAGSLAAIPLGRADRDLEPAPQGPAPRDPRRRRGPRGPRKRRHAAGEARADLARRDRARRRRAA